MQEICALVCLSDLQLSREIFPASESQLDPTIVAAILER